MKYIRTKDSIYEMSMAKEYGIDDLRIALVPFYKIIYSVSEIEKKVFIVLIIYSLSDDTNLIC